MTEADQPGRAAAIRGSLGDAAQLPISGVSHEFSSAVAGLKATGGTLSEALGLLGKSDPELRDLNSASHQPPSDLKPQE